MVKLLSGLAQIKAITHTHTHRERERGGGREGGREGREGRGGGCILRIFLVSFKKSLD